ncbi:site-specific DNA-methyltransferase [Frankia sp. Cr1]|uniref:DNA-methyltransferase n=1 Tax=Frankia sp. Cr1 TaxID=3073931 RepID=UPI002AD44C52|nr:site-specific DNA-methyltransferase [Frankia sp. Cr1]
MNTTAAPDPADRPEPDRPTPPSTPGAQATLYYSEPGVRLYLGDAAAVIATLPADSVDCVVTSPPYWRLRSYGDPDPDLSHIGDQPPAVGTDLYGLEPTPAAYLDRLRMVFTEIARVLVPTGTVWLNLGDSYSTNSDGNWCARPAQPRQPRYPPRADPPYENLLGMPWRVAFALQADGWIVRSCIVWHTPDAIPVPVTDRLATRYELLFLLVRKARYYFNLDAIRQPYTGDRAISRRAHLGGTRPHAASSPRTPWPADQAAAPRGRNPGDVWTSPARPACRGYPPAPPIDLPLRAIAAGCPPGGTVLDPFSGAGTVGLAARQLGRAFVGIDRNGTYHHLSKRALLQQMQHSAESEDGGKVRNDWRSG